MELNTLHPAPGAKRARRRSDSIPGEPIEPEMESAEVDGRNGLDEP